MDPKRADEPETAEVTHRKRRVSAWQATPTWVKISVAVCLGLLLISVTAQNRIIGWFRARSSEGGPAPLTETAKHYEAGKAFDAVLSKLRPIELELSGAALNPATHRIEGAVLNKSNRAYADVKITFAVPTNDFVPADATVVMIPKLAPGEQLKFASDPLPKGNLQWSLLEIKGVPVKP
jgi:hypothetical protein